MPSKLLFSISLCVYGFLWPIWWLKKAVERKSAVKWLCLAWTDIYFSGPKDFQQGFLPRFWSFWGFEVVSNLGWHFPNNASSDWIVLSEQPPNFWIQMGCGSCSMWLVLGRLPRPLDGRELGRWDSRMVFWWSFMSFWQQQHGDGKFIHFRFLPLNIRDYGHISKNQRVEISDLL